MKSEEQIRAKLRELRLANLQISKKEIEYWIDALTWVLEEKEPFSC